MIEATSIRIVEEYLVEVSLSDGRTKVINVLPILSRGYARDFLDPERFKTVRIENGVIVWPGRSRIHPDKPSADDVDICPDRLLEYFTEGA